MKTIYILLTKSETYISKIIQATTNDKYTHASISFDSSLQPLYSFSRLQADMPLPAGLHTESFDSGFFHKYPYLPCTLLALEVEDETYESAKAHVEDMMSRSDSYRYNVMGLIFCRLNIPLNRKSHYFCSEFVGHVLHRSNALELPKDPSLMRPYDYTKIPHLSCLYEGSLFDLLSYLSAKKVSVPQRAFALPL